jgi:hypothetical protein
MALILSDSRCAICAELLDRPFTATSGCAVTADHRLWRYCDAPLHFSCLEAWSSREEFSCLYFDRSLRAYSEGQAGTLLEAGDSWLLACGPAVTEGTASILSVQPGQPYFAEVVLARWPFRLHSRLNEWNDYVTAGFRSGLIGEALVAAEDTMSIVRTLAPTRESIMELRLHRIAEG